MGTQIPDTERTKMLDQEFRAAAAVATADVHDASPASSSEVMTMQEAARFLCVSSRTLERYVREAAIPYAPLPKRGARGSVRFLRSQLIRWLQQRTVRPDRWKGRNGRL
jgi:excisionase family DNA binding protein